MTRSQTMQLMSRATRTRIVIGGTPITADHGNVGRLLSSNTYDLYISNATCGPLGGGKPGWSRGLLDPRVRYMSCLNGFYSVILNKYVPYNRDDDELMDVRTWCPS